ncbi:MAG: D-alanine--D-alanine ligase [Planctomycetaceae bacterium]
MTGSRRVAVLFGGSSPERTVSLESGQAVAAALTDRGHSAVLIDPSTQSVAEVDWDQFDSAFIALHGTYGEDGQVQQQLDSLRVPYTGSSAEASAVTFDKARAKDRFRRDKLTTPKSTLVSSSNDTRTLLEAINKTELPAVVKPTRQGSSVGVTIVRRADEIEPALDHAFQFGSEVLIEDFIAGEEWTVGVINREPLAPIRIDSARAFYDYEAKYADDRTQFHVADSSDDVVFIESLQDVAVQAAKSLSTSGIARVDLMVDKQRRPWLLEVNTIPGFTSHSLIPIAAEAAGISLGELFESVLPPVPSSQRLAG